MPTSNLPFAIAWFLLSAIAWAASVGIGDGLFGLHIFVLQRSLDYRLLFAVETVGRATAFLPLALVQAFLLWRRGYSPIPWILSVLPWLAIMVPAYFLQEWCVSVDGAAIAGLLFGSILGALIGAVSPWRRHSAAAVAAVLGGACGTGASIGFELPGAATSETLFLTVAMGAAALVQLWLPTTSRRRALWGVAFVASMLLASVLHAGCSRYLMQASIAGNGIACLFYAHLRGIVPGFSLAAVTALAVPFVFPHGARSL